MSLEVKRRETSCSVCHMNLVNLIVTIFGLLWLMNLAMMVELAPLKKTLARLQVGRCKYMITSFGQYQQLTLTAPVAFIWTKN